MTERRIGDYEIIGVLGRGGMGVVYRARHLTLGTEVALKRLRSDGASEQLVARFLTEARTAASLAHPNIVHVQHAGFDQTGPFMAMDLVDGESLDAFLEREGPMAAEAAVAAIEPIARALAYAHDRRVLHRDLKPANVILRASDGAPLLTDFGLAKDLTANEHLTRTGQLLGTPEFMAPEQIDGDPRAIGPPADVYGLGATLYALLTGRAPFVGSAIEIASAIVQRSPDSVGSHRGDLDRELVAICDRSLARTAADRPTAMELAVDLRRWLDAERAGKHVGRAARAARRRAGVGVAVALAASAALAGVAALSGVFQGDPGPATGPSRDERPPDVASEVLPEPPPAIPPRSWIGPIAPEGEAPAGREIHASVFDGERVLIFGGRCRVGDDVVAVGDLWAWDGASWEPLDRDPPPGLARYGAAAAWDEGRGRLFVFAGKTDSKTASADVWEWDGRVWERHESRWRTAPDGSWVPSAEDPGPLTWHTASYDRANRRVIVVGGDPAGPRPRTSDVWAWYGEDRRWERLSGTDDASPKPRGKFASAFDAEGRLAVFGGAQGLKPLDDLWTWQDGRWSPSERRAGEAWPSGRASPGLATTPEGQLLLGGHVPLRGGDSRLEGGLWLRRPSGAWVQLPDPPMAPRAYASFVFDERRGVAVLFGGERDGQLLRDVWEYRGGQ